MSPAKKYVPSFLIKVKGTELRHGVSVDVLSVSVTDAIDRPDTFGFTVRERHPEEGRLFAGGVQLKWVDSDVFDEGNEVEIYMGYVDDLALMVRGEITAVTSNFPESGQPSLRVEGLSLYHKLQRQRRREPFEATTDSGIAKEIAADVELRADVDKTAIEYPLFSPKGDTYSKILQDRAKRIGYEVTVKDDVLYFKQRGYLKNPSPVLTLEWGRNLRSFSPRVSTHNMVSEVKVRASQTSQGKGKDPLVGKAKAGDEQVKMGKETGNQIAQRVFGAGAILVEDHHIVSQQEANAVALAHLETRALDFITGRCSCIGNPQLKARTMVELKGLGKSFSGPYYVISATHTIDGSGYRTDFEVKRNGR